MNSRRSSLSVNNNASTTRGSQSEEEYPLEELRENPLSVVEEVDTHSSVLLSEDDKPQTSGENNPTTSGTGPESPRMSKVPLLLRQSPGLGTGSYGAAPAGPSVYASEDDDQQELLHDHKTTKKKGASTLRHALSFQSRSRRRRQNNDTDDEEGTDGSVRLTKSLNPSRRRSMSVAESTVTLEGLQEGGLNSRYSLGGLPVTPTDSDADRDEDTEGDDEVVDVGYDEEDPPDNSRYAQVRASVSALDDLTLSINTPRMWACSILFAILGSSTNLFFSLRYPSVSITPVIAMLLVHPLGLLWDKLLKRAADPEELFIHGQKSYDAPSSATPSPELDIDQVNGAINPVKSLLPKKAPWKRRFRLWLAQGRWNEKEHSCVYIASNVSFGFAFATDVIVEQTHFYKQSVTITYQILLILSTQIIGYAFAGLSRRFLVRPGGMIWPGTLMSAALFGTLHKEENTVANGWKISRNKFFFYVTMGAFAFYFLPGLLFPALSYFSVVTWFFPDNVVVANLFGVSSGLGLFPVTFDWAQIAYIGSPLTTPFWAAMNVVGGLVIVMWIIAPLAYYKNVFFSSYMPILSTAVFDNTGKVYDVQKILTADFLFDRAAYEQYSRVFMPITYVLSYGLQFAAVTSLLTHTACWHGKDIVRQWKNSWKEVKVQDKAGYEPIPGQRRTVSGQPVNNIDRSESNIDDIMTAEDVHNRHMKRYKDAPMWWYLLTAFIMTATGIFVVEYYPVHLPWYGLLLAIGICGILFIPIGIVTAITNQQSSIYLICQLACGALFPGRPVANMVFVTYGYISSAQGIKFSSDLKLGHYMKIPPRILFSVQMAATLVSSLTQIGVLNWMFANVPRICTPEAVNGFSCPLARVHFNGSILWGVVGPAEFFGRNATYRSLMWCFAIGALAPIPLYFYARNRHGSFVRKINLPVLFGSLSWIPPATGLNFSVWALVCYIFNYQIRRRAGAWWLKYTMTLSAALDSGLALGLVVIFFGFVYPGIMGNFSWWGTEVFKRGCDWRACSFKTVPEGGHFGPDKW